MLLRYESDDDLGMMKVVVGNKMDQVSRRVIRTEVGRKWAEQRGMSFMGKWSKQSKHSNLKYILRSLSKGPARC